MKESLDLFSDSFQGNGIKKNHFIMCKNITKERLYQKR